MLYEVITQVEVLETRQDLGTGNHLHGPDGDVGTIKIEFAQVGERRRFRNGDEHLIADIISYNFV